MDRTPRRNLTFTSSLPDSPSLEPMYKSAKKELKETKDEIKELMKRCIDFLGKEQTEYLLVNGSALVKTYDVFTDVAEKKDKEKDFPSKMFYKRAKKTNQCCTIR